jgi:hypothetical protein
LLGTREPERLRPDFPLIDDAGGIIVRELLGMLDRPDYQSGWDMKRAWCERNGFVLDSNLFTTGEIGGPDMRTVHPAA